MTYNFEFVILLTIFFICGEQAIMFGIFDAIQDTVEKELISLKIIDKSINTKPTEREREKENSKLSRDESSRLKRLEESNNLLRVDLQNLSSTLMRKKNEITVINFTLPEEKRFDFNIFISSAIITNNFTPHLTECEKLKQSELTNINLRELKLIAKTWIDRLDITEYFLKTSLRVPTWI